MRNQGRLIDKTHLSLDLAEERGLLHRDYIAHCHRWSHVVKYLNQKHRYKDAVVLDVGCGKEMPLAKLLYVNKMTPAHYVGVDANRFEIPEMLRDKKLTVNAWSQTDFCALKPEDVWMSEDRRPNVVTCFEVFEHVTPKHGRALLKHMQDVTSEDCAYFISTPCYNGSAAQNHVSETTHGALGSLIEDVGFQVDGAWGTFASISDYKDQLSGWTYYYSGDDQGVNYRTVDLTPLFDVLSEYYDTNVLATIFAPLFPASSRNCLWQLSRAKAGYRRKFSKLTDAVTPWTQHPDWRDLAGGELPRGEQVEASTAQ